MSNERYLLRRKTSLSSGAIQEGNILEKSPSSNYWKISWSNGREEWISTDDFDIVERLDHPVSKTILNEVNRFNATVTSWNDKKFESYMSVGNYDFDD